MYLWAISEPWGDPPNFHMPSTLPERAVLGVNKIAASFPIQPSPQGKSRCNCAVRMPGLERFWGSSVHAPGFQGEVRRQFGFLTRRKGRVGNPQGRSQKGVKCQVSVCSSSCKCASVDGPLTTGRGAKMREELYRLSGLGLALTRRVGLLGGQVYAYRCSVYRSWAGCRRYCPEQPLQWLLVSVSERCWASAAEERAHNQGAPESRLRKLMGSMATAESIRPIQAYVDLTSVSIEPCYFWWPNPAFSFVDATVRPYTCHDVRNDLSSTTEYGSARLCLATTNTNVQPGSRHDH